MMKKMMLALTMMVSMLMAGQVFASDVVDINVATVEQLQTVKGIGPKTAAAIVAYREEHGTFSDTKGLTAVKGIGDKKLMKIEGSLTASKIK